MVFENYLKLNNLLYKIRMFCTECGDEAVLYYCESSYFQAYQHEYGKILSDTQIKEIRKIVSRRRIQIEQGISAFLKENESYKFD